MAQSDRLVGKTVQVKGKVTEVCQMAGCWMNLTDDQGNLLRIKVEDGDIVFPKDSVGKMAIAEGKLEKQQMTRQQLIAAAKHEAAESGRTFDPQTVKAGKTIYLLAGAGAVILGQ
jgi:RecJ-like exonuclease